VIRRLSRCFWLTAALAAVLLTATGTAASAIEPPWCGTPIPDASQNLPTEPGSFPHIPWYAIGCTLDDIASRSNGRMTVKVNGQSALGRDKYLVTINALDTKAQRRDYSNGQKIHRFALDDPEHAQKILARVGNDVKVPLYIQGGIHGNEYEGVDASMQLIERLATTPYGTDPEVDRILDHAILLFNPIQNPDGRIAGTRVNGNGFDLNRDFLTQSQPETLSSMTIMQNWLPPDMLDMHGYATPTLIEATTKPHNPGIEYDLWLKWNQSRLDANEAAMNAENFLVQRPVNDWCGDDLPPCPPGTVPGPIYSEGWDDWGPFYTPMYSQLVGLNGSTVEMCNSFSAATGDPTRTPCGSLLSDNARIGRLGARRAQYLTGWSTLLFDTANREDLLNDELKIYRRGVTDAARPTMADLPPGFDNPENYWMHEYPKAYVIPVGEGQRSDPEARRLARWLLANGIRVERLQKDYNYGTTRFERGSYVVWMDQAFRGLADTSLGAGVDVSDRPDIVQDPIDILYAPPGAWSHGYLWGADTLSIPDAANFKPKTQPTRRVRNVPGGVAAARNASAFALAIDSATAVRTLNALLADGVTAELATQPFTNALGEQMPAGTVLFQAGARNALENAGKESGVWFIGVSGPPTGEPLTAPRIAVLTGAVTQEVWSLRNLGFTADPVSTATINTAPTDPLLNYDVIFNTATYPANTPANATVRARLANFFASGGGYVGALTNGASFLTAGGQVTDLTAANRGGAGRSGIINWDNSASGTGVITGAYRVRDTAIVDPPTWFTSVPGTMTVDGSLPLTGFFLSGLWPFDAMSASAPGSPMIAHGTNTAGTARITSFAMNPLYRADPEREWPMLASSVYWVDN
jgi:hypothetical protein